MLVGLDACWLALSYRSASYGPTMGWLLATCWLSIRWLLAGYRQAISWLLAGYRLALRYLLVDHGLAINYPSADYVAKSIHFKTQSYTTICTNVHMAAINTLGCSVFTRFCGYRLTMSQNQYTSRHSHILVCIKVAHYCYQYTFDLRVFMIFFGYWLTMSPNQYTSRHSHVLLCTKVAHCCKAILWTVVGSQDFLDWLTDWRTDSPTFLGYKPNVSSGNIV